MKIITNTSMNAKVRIRNYFDYLRISRLLKYIVSSKYKFRRTKINDMRRHQKVVTVKYAENLLAKGDIEYKKDSEEIEDIFPFKGVNCQKCRGSIDKNSDSSFATGVGWFHPGCLKIIKTKLKKATLRVEGIESNGNLYLDSKHHRGKVKRETANTAEGFFPENFAYFKAVSQRNNKNKNNHKKDEPELLDFKGIVEDINEKVGWELISQQGYDNLAKNGVKSVHRMQNMSSDEWKKLHFSDFIANHIQRVVGKVENSNSFELLKNIQLKKPDPRIKDHSWNFPQISNADYCKLADFSDSVQKNLDFKRVRTPGLLFDDVISAIPRPHVRNVKKEEDILRKTTIYEAHSHGNTRPDKVYKDIPKEYVGYISNE